MRFALLVAFVVGLPAVIGYLAGHHVGYGRGWDDAMEEEYGVPGSSEDDK